MLNQMDQKTDVEIQLPIIIEKCPICGKVFKGQSDYCELCGKTLRPVHIIIQTNTITNNASNNTDVVKTDEQSKKIQAIETFFNRSTNYFVILSVIGALISLLPVFLDVVIGKNWLNQLLGTQLGFYCLILLLIATYSGALFILEILVIICSIFYEEVFQTCKCSPAEKILLSTFLIIGVIAIFSLVIFLLLSWITKLDYSINFVIIIIILIGSLLLIIALYSAFFFEIIKKIEKRWVKFLAIFLIVGVIAFILFCIVPVIWPSFGEISKYYDKKAFDVNLTNESYSIPKDTPLIIPLTYSLPGYTGNFTFFDISYARCHWSTNYGYFITSNKNGTLIKRYEREIVIPKCPYTDDKIFWTYDIGDYGESKPEVRIGFIIEDDNQNKNIGEAHLNFVWNETKKDHVDNISSSLL